MDVFKRDSIQITEFKRILEDDTIRTNGTTERSGKTTVRENHSSDWKRHAKQQIGLFISKQFPSVHESFEGSAFIIYFPFSLLIQF